MTPAPARLAYATDVVVHLVGREFRLRYRRALFGWLWAIAQPLARLVVLSFVFTKVLPLGIKNYAAFLFTGLIGWTWFASGVMSGTRSALDRTDLLAQHHLPRATIPVVSVLADFLDYLAAFPVLLAFLVISGTGLHASLLALPIILAVEFLFIVGFGYALCAANVYFRDIHLLVNVALFLGFYVTPVFYQAAQIPSEFRWVVRFNPMARLIVAQRRVVLDGMLPGTWAFLALTGVCAATALVGYLVYRRASPDFLDEL